MRSCGVQAPEGRRRARAGGPQAFIGRLSRTLAARRRHSAVRTARARHEGRAAAPSPHVIGLAAAQGTFSCRSRRGEPPWAGAAGRASLASRREATRRVVAERQGWAGRAHHRASAPRARRAVEAPNGGPALGRHLYRTRASGERRCRAASARRRQSRCRAAKAAGTSYIRSAARPRRAAHAAKAVSVRSGEHTHAAAAAASWGSASWLAGCMLGYMHEHRGRIAARPCASGCSPREEGAALAVANSSSPLGASSKAGTCAAAARCVMLLGLSGRLGGKDLGAVPAPLRRGADFSKRPMRASSRTRPPHRRLQRQAAGSSRKRSASERAAPNVAGRCKARKDRLMSGMIDEARSSILRGENAAASSSLQREGGDSCRGAPLAVPRSRALGRLTRSLGRGLQPSRPQVW
jgi:hypothetical protein